MTKSPVVLIGFNRPDLTRRVMLAIREFRPQVLFLVSDGPRPHRPSEDSLVSESREIMESVDWACDVRRIYSDVNLGCKKRVSSGITEVFRHVDQAIILEDDCLPHASFFEFCEAQLRSFKSDERVSVVSGQLVPTSYQFSTRYVFSRYSFIWGWATWARTWRDYDVRISGWPKLKDQNFLSQVFGADQRAIRFWTQNFDLIYSGQLDTWDHQLSLSNWLHNRVCVVPSKNLVSNLGFRADATHTTGNSRYAELPVGNIDPSLSMPSEVRAVLEFDKTVQNEFFSPSTRFLIQRKSRELLARIRSRS